MVHKESSAGFHELLRAFEDLTGTPVLMNTSFNRQGEPMVGDAISAVRSFAAGGIDALACGPLIVEAPG